MISKFLPEHLEQVDPLDVYSGENNTKKLILEVYEAPGSHIRTLFSVRGEVLAVFGGFANGHKMSIWAYASKLIYKYPKQYHSSMLKVIEEASKEFSLVRMESVIFADNIVALKQHKALGFEVEGLMRRSGPKGQDEILLARIF
jgi:hypothetical protein